MYVAGFCDSVPYPYTKMTLIVLVLPYGAMFRTTGKLDSQTPHVSKTFVGLLCLAFSSTPNTE